LDGKWYCCRDGGGTTVPQQQPKDHGVDNRKREPSQSVAMKNKGEGGREKFFLGGKRVRNNPVASEKGRRGVVEEWGATK